MLSRLKNPVELYHKCILKNSKNYEPAFYANYLTSLNTVRLRFLQVVKILVQWKNQYLVLLSCMLCRKVRVHVCSVYCHPILFCWCKIVSDHFKDDIIPLLKAKDRLKISQNVSLVLSKRSENYDANYHIKYSSNKMDMSHCLKYLHLQH